VTGISADFVSDKRRTALAVSIRIRAVFLSDENLCGAGVAFKLAQALLEKSGRQRLLPSFLKVAAIGTIADIVPLAGENRIFAKLGLAGLRQPVNPDSKPLRCAKPQRQAPLSAGDIGFRIGRTN